MRLPSMNLKKGFTRLYIVLSLTAWVIWFFNFRNVAGRSISTREWETFWAMGVIAQVSSCIIALGIVWVIKGFKDIPEEPQRVVKHDLPEDFDSDK